MASKEQTVPLVARELTDPLRNIASESEALVPLKAVLTDHSHGIFLYQGNTLEVLDKLVEKYADGCFDMIFADPPYFLSNGGITCHGGKMVKVDKGEWDKSRGAEENHNFNREWLSRCQRVLKPNGTIWVTGTYHVIFSVGYAMQQLGFKILNDIAWEKPNPPPNLSCRYFTHSTESLIWAAKSVNSVHVFNYSTMKSVSGKQMKTVWRNGQLTKQEPDVPDIWTIPSPSADEKRFGKHPTQKPVGLLERCMLASTNEGDFVLDPFLGSGTTAVACARLGRNCVGLDLDLGHVNVAANRVRATLSQTQLNLTR